MFYEHNIIIKLETFTYDL